MLELSRWIALRSGQLDLGTTRPSIRATRATDRVRRRFMLKVAKAVEGCAVHAKAYDPVRTDKK
jgi:hypothetical protein